MNKPFTKLDLYDPTWKIFTKSEEKPPVKVLDQACVQTSLISNGCIIEGTVINSVLSPGVRVGKGSVVKDSIVLNDTIISENVTIDRCIIDKHVVVGHDSHLGFGDDLTANIEKPDILSSGITVVEKSAIIPSDTRIGRNCRIFKNGSYPSKNISSGSTIK